MLWQLQKLSTKEALNTAGHLPENWGPIFGLNGVQEKIGDLSWLGKDYEDMGWVQVEGEDVEVVAVATDSEKAWEKAKQLLRDSDWAVLPDVPMTAGEKDDWIEYRRKIREIRSHVDFPNVVWPASPE